MSVLLVVGAGGHGKVVADLADLLGCWRSIVFADDRFPELTHISRWPVVSTTQATDLANIPFDAFVVAVGDNRLRLKLQQQLLDSSYSAATLIHPSAVVSPSVVLGCGTVVFANAVINIDAKIGAACIINTAATVDHDCVLEDGVHISPGAHLAGAVQVGKATWLGIGSCVIQSVTIGQHVVLGAGAVAISDLPDGVTAKGIPARFSL